MAGGLAAAASCLEGKHFSALLSVQGWWGCLAFCSPGSMHRVHGTNPLPPRHSVRSLFACPSRLPPHALWVVAAATGSFLLQQAHKASTRCALCILQHSATWTSPPSTTHPPPTTTFTLANFSDRHNRQAHPVLTLPLRASPFSLRLPLPESHRSSSAASPLRNPLPA